MYIELVYSNLRKAIELSGKSYDVVADAIGLSRGGVLSNSIANETLKLSYIEKICTFLDVPFQSLLVGTFPYVATAGTLDGQIVAEPVTEYLPKMNFEPVVIEVMGSSMDPVIRDGDKAVCRKIERGETIKPERVYIVEHVRDGFTCKYLRDNGKQFELVPANDTVKPYRVNKLDIKAIFEVNYKISKL